MTRFPVDVPIKKVIKTFETLGFQLVREGNHIAMVRENPTIAILSRHDRLLLEI